MFDWRCCSLALLALGSSACGDTPRSCDLNTSSLVLRATVSDLDDGVEVEIELETASEVEPGTSSGTTLALCPDSDRLEVNGTEAEAVHAIGHLYYVVEFSSPEPSYEISLARKDHESVSVIVDMPPGLEISTPAEGEELSRADPLEVGWTPDWPGEVVGLTLAGEIGSSCIEGLGVDIEVDDTGSYGIAANTLVGGGAVPDCEVTLSLTRIAEAEYPAALAEGGSVSAIVKRRRPFTSVD